MHQKQIKPYKRDVDAVKLVFPNADHDDFTKQNDAGEDVTFYMVGDDWEEGDGVIGLGWTVRDAWADAARRVKANPLNPYITDTL